MSNNAMSTPANNAMLFLISAPSGGGKTTLCDQVLANNPTMTRAITCTTRAPREGEHHGTDYYFMDPAAFEVRVGAGDFLEHATVHGNHYGTLKSEVMDKLARNQDVLLSIDVQGAATIRTQASQDPALQRALVTVFLAPPTLRTLEERLIRRGKDSPEVIQRRLGAARQEIAHWQSYDYLITSTSVSEDFERFQSIWSAEKMKVFRSNGPKLD